MYTVEGFDIYGTWVAVGVISSIILTIVNYLGIKPAAFMQNVFTVIIAAIGIVLMIGALKSGHMSNAKPMFEDGSAGVIFFIYAKKKFPDFGRALNIRLEEVPEDQE